MKKIIYWIFVVFVLLLTLFLLIKLIYKNYQNKMTKSSINYANEVMSKVIESDDITIKKLQVSYGNKDIIGILKIDSLNIFEPILKTTNNSYYLIYNVAKEYSKAGAIFMDYRNDFSSKQINIYGHNSPQFNTPFTKLKEYLSKIFYEEHPYIEILYDRGKLKYQIFSISTKDKLKEHEKLFFKTDTEWNNHVNILKNNSDFSTNIQVNEKDDILVLQTCLDNDSLLVISSRKVEE